MICLVLHGPLNCNSVTRTRDWGRFLHATRGLAVTVHICCTLLSPGFGSTAVLPVPIRDIRADFKRSDKRWHRFSMEEHMRELPNVDDLQVVAEIAEAELAELRKITQAADVLRDQHAVSRRAATKTEPRCFMSLVSVSLTCTGDIVHVHIAPLPQVRRAASEFSWASGHPISVLRMCQLFNHSHSVFMVFPRFYGGDTFIVLAHLV